ncbi:MAG: hydroxymethylglutaryl-CoA synthase family protein [Chloroflexi bacterium]|nr:hydroxymethylglutaryl-CoA synthase family protein [Chloroflexota bacterium]MBM3153823.1 hydroxymethylglutaryl-CoA synthase family protein [Chloroflexota bacterium]MBM3174409.1 hydroxymethylglutaryl-CoA synthase family protein [Chloroflexota bacterium]MBM4449971.1 hydroxymethylglutaryl-CoA synthase family protein [Chloroflexota bacterium]
MIGIIACGAYIPLWRLPRDAIAAAWGRQSLGGERSVANNDEDTVTMAVEAVFDCLAGVSRDTVDGLYFASTTSPFREKQCAALAAAAADLKTEIITADYSNSLRSSTNALRAALDAVSSGSARSMLVVASDCRLAYPRSDYEQGFGDAAAAFLIGNTSTPIATFEAHYSISNEMYDVWRLDKDTYVQSWEDRFVVEKGYIENMQKAVSSLLKKEKLSPGSINKAIFYAPNPRVQHQLARALGFDVQKQIQDLLFDRMGVCGCAHAMLMLAVALEEAKADDILLLASYGDGSDAFLLKVTGAAKSKGNKHGVMGYLSSKKLLPSYEKYLSYRGLLEPQPGEPFRLFPSASASWRERNSSIRLHGSKCKNCGLVTFPIQRVCYGCQSKDNYSEVRLSDRRGAIFTFSLDNLAGRSDDPVIPQIVIESEMDNTRIYCMMTDCAPNEIKIGMPVEMTFRRIYEGASMYNYFWKCRPPR